MRKTLLKSPPTLSKKGVHGKFYIHIPQFSCINAENVFHLIFQAHIFLNVVQEGNQRYIDRLAFVSLLFYYHRHWGTA